MAVTSYGRNKNHDDEIKKKTKRRPIIASAIAVRLLKKKQAEANNTSAKLSQLFKDKHVHKMLQLREPRSSVSRINH